MTVKRTSQVVVEALSPALPPKLRLSQSAVEVMSLVVVPPTAQFSQVALEVASTDSSLVSVLPGLFINT